jgi:poly-gamma-glutamate capsule biosynthesis protein CapA/YwtB (metallophosphatase superfamily)
MARLGQLACGRLVLVATGLAIAVTLGATVWPQTPPLNIILTGQSMIRSDIRVNSPSVASTIASMLKGDVVFTNYEGAVAEPGQPNEAAPQQGAETLAPPVTLDALKSLGFNFLSLANNHSWDLRVPGIQNTLREVSRLDMAHAGTGNTLKEAAAPAYLRTPRGIVGLVAMASGAIPPEGAATATRPGVNELRVEAGNKPNEEDAQRILQSIRDASKRADLVIVYQHNHIYDKPFGTIFAEELPDRLVPPDWIKKWAHAEVEAGVDIVILHGAPVVQGVEIYHSRPIFLRSGQLHL